jgi:hypothetical protein
MDSGLEEWEDRHRSTQSPPSHLKNSLFTNTDTDHTVHTSAQPPPLSGSATWKNATDVAVSFFRKRTSSSDLRRDSLGGTKGPDSDNSKRQKVEFAAKTTLPDVIVISDDEDNGEDGSVGSAVDSQVAPIHPDVSSSASQPPPVDHLGRPLSDAALAAAREYWDCQRKLDSCPFDQKDAQGSALPFDLLLELAWYRRSYTQLLFGLSKLESGTRTYEPPYVHALPPPSFLAPGQTSDTTTPVPPNVPQPKPKTEPVLGPEQLELVELAASGRNIFYTGSAGCGKSTVLHAIRARLRKMGKKVRVMAPTGKVALAINGTTTWTFAGWTPDHHKRELDLLRKAARGKTARKRFMQTDTIIIDEISMVENLHLERLNEVMKVGRSSSSPFGGVQVIVTGDFCQLPPVKPFQHCIECGSGLVSTDEEEDTTHSCPKCKRVFRDNDKWAFRSQAWAECDFAHVHLKSIHRQSDDQFISMLQKWYVRFVLFAPNGSQTLPMQLDCEMTNIVGKPPRRPLHPRGSGHPDDPPIRHRQRSQAILDARRGPTHQRSRLCATQDAAPPLPLLR